MAELVQVTTTDGGGEIRSVTVASLIRHRASSQTCLECGLRDVRWQMYLTGKGKWLCTNCYWWEEDHGWRLS